MVSITQFERSVTESNVCFLCGFCGDLGLIDDALSSFRNERYKHATEHGVTLCVT